MYFIQILCEMWISLSVELWIKDFSYHNNAVNELIKAEYADFLWCLLGVTLVRCIFSTFMNKINFASTEFLFVALYQVFLNTFILINGC